MSAADSSQPAGTGRRNSKGLIQAIEFGRRSAKVTEIVTPSYSKYIGRVGALAVALGIGSAISAMPMAYADTTGSAGSTSDQATSGSSASTKSSPARRGGRGGASSDSTSNNDS